MANPLMLIPALINLLSGAPNAATIASNLISAIGPETNNNSIASLIAAPYKDGLAYLNNYNIEPDPQKKKQHAELARRAFISASSVETDSLRVAKAKLYVSSASRLLGDDALARSWAEQAYVDLSMAETLAWRIIQIGQQEPSLQVDLEGKSFLGPKGTSYRYSWPWCDRTHEEEIQGFKRTYAYWAALAPHMLGDTVNTAAISIRQAKLTEIYAIKDPLAKYLKTHGSKISELDQPVGIALHDYQGGAIAATRLSDSQCPNRKSNNR